MAMTTPTLLPGIDHLTVATALEPNHDLAWSLEDAPQWRRDGTVRRVPGAPLCIASSKRGMTEHVGEEGNDFGGYEEAEYYPYRCQGSGEPLMAMP
jgi:hypothetical protein